MNRGVFHTGNRNYGRYFIHIQKAGICNYLRALVKQNLNSTCSDILDKFIEDEKYYLELNTSRFPFLCEYIEKDTFLKDTELFIKECIIYMK